MPLGFTQDQIALINLLLRIAVMAGIVSLVIGFRFTTDILIRKSVPRGEKLKLLVLLAFIFSIGVLIRKLSAQAAMDLSLEGALLAGFIGGTWVGAGTGFVIGMTCFLLGEWISLPLYTFAGFLAGFLYQSLSRRGEVWNYSLNPLLVVYNFFEKLVKGSFDLNVIPLVLGVAFALARYYLVGRYGESGLIYGYPERDWVFITVDIIVMVYTMGIALKLAGNARSEVIYREEEKQLVHARLTTLRSQINPHFLFNTLNSITSLIRTDAERAREMTRRLSSIFRKSLEESGDIHSLASEIEFIDDYLSIEEVRFGSNNLRIEKDLDPATLSSHLPSLLLQPLVENSIKHGISGRTDGGTIRIKSAAVKGGMEITIENDGPETGELELGSLLGKGVGLRNVMERLDIYSCGEGEMSIDARDGGGAVIRLFIPGNIERGRIANDACDNSG
jgi:two-component system LytT family sensor kinase